MLKLMFVSLIVLARYCQIAQAFIRNDVSKLTPIKETEFRIMRMLSLSPLNDLGFSKDNHNTISRKILTGPSETDIKSMLERIERTKIKRRSFKKIRSIFKKVFSSHKGKTTIKKKGNDFKDYGTILWIG